MTRRTLPLLFALLGALFAAASPAAAAAKSTSSCKPTGLTVTRSPGSTKAKLTWGKPRKAPKGARYRVYAGNAVVGQTGRTAMKVRVTFGKRYRFKVRVLTHAGHATGCAALKTVSVVYQRPTTPDHVGASDAGPGNVHLTWAPSTGGEATVTGYRIYRDGVVHQKPAGTSTDVKIKQGETFRYEVAAVDSRGYVSDRSPAVTLAYDHKSPATPAGLSASDVSDSAVTLSWQPVDHVAGYRVLRDGQPVRQTSGTSMRVENLYSSRTYSFTVVAVDSLSYVSAASEAVPVTTGTPPATTGPAHAFLLASTDQSFRDFQANYRRIGTIYPTFYDCNTASAALTGKNDPLITGYAQARRVAVLPRFNCQSTPVVHRILTDPATRSKWLDGMVGLTDQYGYDGVNVDFEAGAAADRNAYTSFVADLADRLHAKGRQVSLAVSGKTWDQPNHPRSTIFDYAALAQHADHIFVMAWGIHWAGSAPGAQDDLPWWTAVADYVATIPNKERFVMGMQLYAMDWADNPRSGERAEMYEYPEAIKRAAAAGVTPERDPASEAMHFSYRAADGRTRQVWFADATTQATRVQMAKDRGLGGVGFWRLGNEDQRIWDNPLFGARGLWP
jgi:spore germination protein YaaH